MVPNTGKNGRAGEQLPQAAWSNLIKLLTIHVRCFTTITFMAAYDRIMKAQEEPSNVRIEIQSKSTTSLKRKFPWPHWNNKLSFETIRWKPYLPRSGKQSVVQHWVHVMTDFLTLTVGIKTVEKKVSKSEGHSSWWSNEFQARLILRSPKGAYTTIPKSFEIRPLRSRIAGTGVPLIPHHFLQRGEGRMKEIPGGSKDEEECHPSGGSRQLPTTALIKSTFIVTRRDHSRFISSRAEWLSEFE